MSILLNVIYDMICAEFALNEPVWTTAPIKATDIQRLKKECSQPSDFDPYNTRITLLNKMTANTCEYRTCPYGEVIAIYEQPEQSNDIPWGLWARILRLYHGKKPFTIFFLANSHLRTFPVKKPITPHNINGGYTYPCSHDMIVIYRAEDATRVLIHELQHASCLDHQQHGVDLVEAETEAWAELLYCALLSHGQRDLFQQFIRQQSQWIVTQNQKVKQYLSTPTAFPWRYTIAKENVWRRWGIFNPYTTQPSTIQSLRLTISPSIHIKKFFNVSSSSLIL
jgi:hypothetical protein